MIGERTLDLEYSRKMNFYEIDLLYYNTHSSNFRFPVIQRDELWMYSPS